MSVLSLVWGILSLVGMFIGLIPLLGWYNWINIPFAVIGLIIGIVAVSTGAPDRRGPAIAGLVCCAIAIFLGAIRLTIGFGIF
jgi:uncharacterized membrane protein YgaE (UPF0421/DUF939 family)